MNEDASFIESAAQAIERDDKEALVRMATKAFFTDFGRYEQIRKHAAESGYYLIIRPQRDFYEPHTFNFGLVITDQREEIYFGCKKGWDFPSTIEDWWSEGSTRTMMKSFLFHLFADISKGQLEDIENNRSSVKSALELIEQVVKQRGPISLGERMEIESRFLPEKQMLDVPLYARRTAQSALKSLDHAYPKALSSGQKQQIDEILAIDLS